MGKINMFSFGTEYKGLWLLDTMNLIVRRFYSSLREKSVFISRSNNVFENLALEHWYYRHYDFTNKSMLLLWINQNCVVIGQHQNPWLEVNYIPTIDVQVARRRSGGGTVYHDSGNLNLSFFTHKKEYNRKKNLELIVQTLKNEWSIVTGINKREDIVFNDKYKISGTASRFGTNAAYHHCTLLINCNREYMSKLLGKHEKHIETNATVSVPSDVMNLKQIDNKISINRLMTAVGMDYLQLVGDKKTINHGFNYITPNEETFPGINSIKEEMSSWQWRYGRTPKFTITVKSNNGSAVVSVINGKIENVSTLLKVSLDHFISKQFSENIVNDIKTCLDVM